MNRLKMLLVGLISLVIAGCTPAYAWNGGWKQMQLEENGSIPVTLQDQTTPILIAPLHNLIGTTALSTQVAVDDYSMTVDSATGFADDVLIIVSDATNDEIWYGRQVGAAVGNVISFDRPMDYAFAAGVVVTTNTTNMNVNGSVTPVTFSLRQGTAGVSITADIVRIMIIMFTDSAVSLATFGDIAKLTNGITLRYVNATYHNIFNVKNNGSIAAIAYDLQIYAATNPTFGQDGLSARLTFGGQNKMGVVIRIDENSDLELIIRDDLTGLTTFKIIAEGSVAIVD